MKEGKNGPAAEMQLNELTLEKDTKLTKSKDEKCCSAFRPVHHMEEVVAWICKECGDISCKGCLEKCCNVEVVKKRLPILKWLPRYRIADLRGDLIAGVTLGLTVIPQSLAYAKIAELPTQYGLYTSFMCYFAYCLFGTARDVNLGPTAVLSLLTAEFTHQIPQLATMLALICGIAQIIMGILNIGFLVEFISHTIINSFTTAAALAIVFSQVKKWLGLSGIPRDFARQLYWTIVKIPETQKVLWMDFTLGLVCMIFLFLLKKLKTVKFESTNLMATINFISTARNAITIFVASTVAAVLLHYDLKPFTLTGNITSGIPPFSPPSFYIDLANNVTLTPSESFQKLGIGSVITPLVGLIEVIAIGKAFGKKNSYKVDADQEFFALGVSNILGSFVSAYPVTGSFSRSAVAAQSGIRTPAANIVTGFLVLLALAFLTPVFYYIPTPGLAAVIMMAVTDLVDFSMIKQLWIINKSDLIPWFATFFISLLFGFEYGILIGVAVSLLFLLHPWAKPDIQIYPLENISIEVEGSQLKCGLPEDMIEPEENILVINLSLGLLFPGAENFEERVLERANFESLIFDFSRVTQMDFSAASSLGHLASDLKKKNIRFVFVNVEKAIAEKLQKVKQGDFAVADSMDEAVILLKMMKKKAVEGDVKIFIDDDDDDGDQSKTQEVKKQSLEVVDKPQNDPDGNKKEKENENKRLLK